MKRIIFTAPYTAELVEDERPTATPGHAVVRVLVSSISSGTERANISGDPSIGCGSTLEEAKRTLHFPRYGGYSTSGIVEEVGNGNTDLKPGDRVAMSGTTHNQYVSVPFSCIYKLPENVSDAAGALIYIATFPEAAIRKCHMEFGESSIVMGLGVLGLIAVKLLRVAGAVPIIAVDPNPERRAQAMKFGADYALDPFDDGFAGKVKELTGGGAKVAIEVTGNGKALDQVLDCMASFGRVALLGCTRNSDFTIDYYRKIHGPGITLVGAHTCARPSGNSSSGWWTIRDDAHAIIDLISMGRLNLHELVEDVRSPVEAPEVYARLCSERSFPVTQFDWRRLD